MKILLVTGKLFDELYEGTQKSVVNLANGLVEEGHDVYWLTREVYEGENFREQGPPDELNSEVEVKWINFSKSNFLRIRRVVKEMDPDVINPHTSSPRMSLFWTLNFPLRTVVTLPCWRNWSKKEKFFLRFTRKTATTRSIAGKLPGKAEITRYPVNIKKYNDFKDIDVSEPTLFYIGEPSEHRGFDQACKVLSKVRKDFKFKVAVAEALGDEQTAKRKLKDNNIWKNTELTTGFVEDLPSYINEGDICLNLLQHCRRTTSPPIFGLEAMSCGRIPIFSDVPEFEEVIDNGKNGFTVDNKDFRGIANRIEWLVENPDKAKEIGKNARKEIIKNYSVKTSVKRFEEVYSFLDR